MPIIRARRGGAGEKVAAIGCTQGGDGKVIRIPSVARFLSVSRGFPCPESLGNFLGYMKYKP